MTRPRESDCQELIAILNTWGSARVLEPGRIELIAGSSVGVSRRVEILLSAEDWETMWTVAFGDVTAAAGSIRHSFDRLGQADRFLVYNNQYEVVPSPDENVPIDPEVAELLRSLKEVPPTPGTDYGWFAYPPSD